MEKYKMNPRMWEGSHWENIMTKLNSLCIDEEFYHRLYIMTMRSETKSDLESLGVTIINAMYEQEKTNKCTGNQPEILQSNQEADKDDEGSV